MKYIYIIVISVFSITTSISQEKFWDLQECVDYALENNISILLLGSGDTETETQLEALKSLKNFNAFIGYDETLSHRIYAGADFLLMPSRVEPCGLNQMYALRYGTIPVVNAIGGLKDTVIDIENDGFGICHEHATVEDATYAIERACELYKDQTRFKKIRKLSQAKNDTKDIAKWAVENTDDDKTDDDKTIDENFKD